jgi:hypothetical protein
MVTGTTFIITSALKLCAMGASALTLVTGVQYFLNFEWKPAPKKGKGGEDIEGESVRQRLR